MAYIDIATRHSIAVIQTPVSATSLPALIWTLYQSGRCVVVSLCGLHFCVSGMELKMLDASLMASMSFPLVLSY